jgi:predicted lipid-binding transport protein (Tim44 family)
MSKRLMAMAVVLLFSVVAAGEGFARTGGGRSSGSRGSRSMSSPSRPSASPGSPSSSSPYRQGASPQMQPQGGGFLRGMGAGMLGGFLGSMLVGGFGGSGCGSRAEKKAAAPSGGGSPQQDNTGQQVKTGQQESTGQQEKSGGMGFLDVILLAGLAFLVYRYIMKRRMARQQDSTGFPTPLPPAEAVPSSAPFPYAEGDSGKADILLGIGRIRQMDPSFDERAFCEQATDLFFRLQGAWTRRDLGPVADMLTGGMREALQGDVDGMKANRQVNRLENIAVRSVEITEAWQESGQDYVTALFVASLLDYTTDEAGKVLTGSDTAPVKFEEFWTLARPVGPGPWKLSAIQQP